jgi:hypothetical protein
MGVTGNEAMLAAEAKYFGEFRTRREETENE